MISGPSSPRILDVRTFGRFVKILSISGIAVALVLAVVLPVGAFAIQSAGSQIQLQPLHIHPIDQPSYVYDNCNPGKGSNHCNSSDIIATLSNNDFAQPVKSISDVPPIVIKAILSAEDHTFWEHGPIDVRSIFRAAEQDIIHHQIVQGGSTITQQVVKNEILTPQRTFQRKITELIDSYRLFNKWGRSKILLEYLNTVYFGYGAYGVQAAAHVFFGTTVDQLNGAQAALLAGMIRNPSLYDPISFPKNALFRRNSVINQMVSYTNLSPQISKAQGKFLKALPLPKVVYPPAQQQYSPFVTEVVQYLLSNPALGATPALRYHELFKGGLKIYTSYDPSLQAKAQAAVAAHLPNTNGKFTAALIAMNPANGYVDALVPGNPKSNLGYDVATGYGGLGRQPGSSFKGVVMAAALEQGIGPGDTVDGTSPCTFQMPGGQKPYVANNADSGFGIVTVQLALTDSINCAFIKIGLAAGDQRLVTMGEQMGINDPLGINPRLPGSPTNPLVPLPSMAIGSEDATPLEMASVYATIDDGGIYHTPVFVTKVVSPSTGGNQVLLNNTLNPGKRVLTLANAEIETQMLEQVIEYGTGTAAQLPNRPAAGKTGTTNQFTDGWFVGFTPQLVTAVWMGDPAGEVPMYDVGGITVYGGTYPAEMWQTFMSSALKGQPVLQFKSPPPSSIPAGGQYIDCGSFTSGSFGAPPTTSANGSPPPSSSNSGPTTCLLTGLSNPTTSTSSTSSEAPSSTTSSTSSTSTTPSSTTLTVPRSTTTSSSTTFPPTSSTFTIPSPSSSTIP